MKDGLHTFWLRNEQKHPVTFVAALKEGNVVKYAMATHNPVDKFNRTTARNKAIGRLSAIKKPPKSFELPEGEDPKKFLLRQIMENPGNTWAARMLAADALGLQFVEWWVKNVRKEAMKRIEASGG